MPTIRTRMPSLITFSLWAGLLLVIAVGAGSYYQIGNMIASGREERRVVELLRQLERIGNALSATEQAALRRSLSPKDLPEAEYLAARGATLALVRQIKTLVRDGEVRRMLYLLSAAMDRHLSAIDASAKSPTPIDARGTIVSRTKTRREINTLIDSIRQREYLLLSRIEVATESEVDDTALLILFGATMAACLVLWAMVLIRRHQRLRERSESQLRTEKERFAFALEGAAAVVWDWNLVTDQVYLSANWFGLLGETPSETPALSKQLFQLVHPADRTRVQELIRDTIMGKSEIYDAEHRVRHSNGSYLWISSQGKVIERSPEGKALRLTGTNRNVTGRKNAELAIRLRDERLQLAQASASMVSWFWDSDKNEVEWQDEPARLAGPAPAGGYSGLQDMVHPEDLVSFLQALNQSAQNGQPWRLECRMTRTDGSTLWIAIYGRPQPCEDGKVKSVIGIAQDISDIKRAEQALSDSERQIRQLIDAVPVVISYADHECRIRLCNLAMTRLLDLPFKSILGRTMKELFGNATYAELQPYVLRAFAGETLHFERTQRMRHGGLADLSVTYIPRHDMQGRVEGFYSLVMDISELKRLDRMKSEFVSTVSHELRTPLTSIRGSLGLVAGGVAGQLPEKARELVEIARNNCERLIRLINDILDIEKLESGQLAFNSKVLDLMAVVEQAMKTNEGYAEQHRTRLNLVSAAAGAQVLGDQDRLVQVLTNLISNACKFSPPASSVDIAVTREEAFIRVSITDHGQGISEEFRKRIFQRFSQDDSRDSRQKGGTGLGLSISKAIVERMSGTIGFDSQPGVGTTFYFNLPEWQARQQSPRPRDSRPRVLLCGDNEDTGCMLQALLEEEGYQADVATTAARARELASGSDYAVLLVDHGTTGAAGLHCLREVSSAMETRHLPVIVTSSTIEEGNLKFGAGQPVISDWLTKPIEEERLISCLNELSGDRGRQRILHVEDDADVRRVVSTIAGDFADCDAAENITQARAMIERKAYDLVLLDLGLPDGSGWDLVPDLERLNPPPRIVVFSASHAQDGERHAVDACLVKSQTSERQLLETLEKMTRHTAQKEPT